MKKLILSIIFFLLFLSKANAAFYDVIDIGYKGAVGGATGSNINEHGNISGTTADSNGFNDHAFYWDGTMHDIYAPQGGITIGYGLNDNNQVVGTFQDSSAFIYDGSLQSLNISFIPYDINNQQIIVGGSNTARMYDLNTGIETDLGTFRDYSRANAINEAGQIVGTTTTTGDPVSSSFIYKDNQMSIQSPGQVANDINESGIVVGNGRTNVPFGFIYDSNTLHTDYIRNPYDLLISAFAINDGNVVVGTYSTPEANDNQRAYLFDNDFHDLNDFISTTSEWVLAEATDINNSGQIVGWGYYQDEKRVFLLNPVPEPATMFLFLSGLVGVFFRKRRA